MPVAIALKFPSGHYHATVWGRHVNEGSVEWPPFPWRILRAIVAAWKVRTDGSDAVLESVVQKLAAPPEFYLPPATIGHARHYMPLYRGNRTLVFDTFAVLDRNTELQVVWPDVDLTQEEALSLSGALRRLTYLGRAESWCEARLMECSTAATNCHPPRPGMAGADADTEAVRVLTVDSARAIAPGTAPEVWPLCRTTLDLRNERWSDPPGSAWVTYWRRSDCFAGGALRRIEKPSKKYTVARFALHSRVRPLVTETIAIGEFARQELQGCYGFLHSGTASPVFSGRDSDGNPRQDHNHAFFLPTDEDRDGRIDHLTVYAKVGFGDGELRALDRFREFRQVGKNRPDIRPVLIALGTETEVGNHHLFRKSTKWESITPYVPVRHTKRRGGIWVDTAADQLCRELEKRGIGTMPRVIAQYERDMRGRRWVEYRLERLLGGGTHGQLYGNGFVVQFAEPVAGPISLGYGCHFGLGQFRAME